MCLASFRVIRMHACRGGIGFSDEVVPHLAPGRVPSTVDPDVDNPSMKPDSRFQKSVVRFSAWLDPNEAARAAAKARRSASVLRPLKMQDSSLADTDYTSTMSSRSSISTEFGHPGRRNVGEATSNSPQGHQGMPFAFGRAGSKSERVDTGTQSSCSSPSRASVNESGWTSSLPSQGRFTVRVPPRSTSMGQPMQLTVGQLAGFSQALTNYYPMSATKNALGFALRKNERAAVDSLQSRKQPLEIAFKLKNADFPVNLCIQRADARIPCGRASIPVRSIAKGVTLAQGFTCVRGIHAAHHLLSTFRVHPEPVNCNEPHDKLVEQGFVKFPRTGHLYNFGSATRDDLIMNETETRGFLSAKDTTIRIVVQEKIDGANLGITLDAHTGAFRVQNRSHYVTSKSHAQFKKLYLWLQNHQADLWNVLTCNDTLPPGHLILFGEWVFAKHSIHYTKLPDLFVAFDLYDTVQKRFYSSLRLRDILKTTSLCVIHEFQVDGILSKKVIEQLVCTQSVYYDGMVEGVYVRWETDMWAVDRAKAVRPNFVCGNEDWSKGKITMNQLAINQDE